MLAARRAPGAELRAHGQRHLRGAAGHERQLRGLVEQLVEADAEEVEVHQLDDGAHARHRRADAEADDRALGDRRVADAIAEAVVQPAREAEHVAAGGDVDPGDEHALVAGELGFERGADRVHRAEHRCIGGAAGRRLGGRSGRGRTTKSASVAAGGRASCRAAVDGFVELARDRRLHGCERVVGDAGRSAAGARGRAAGRALPTREPRRAIGSARGRLRSDRASGRWSPRRRPDRVPRASPRPPTRIAVAVATTSLPSTAT